MIRYTNMFQLVAVALLFLSGCGTPPDYKELRRRAQASGEVHEDLFLEITFDMASRDFFDHCTGLNKKRLITQGPGNLSVQYIPEELDHPGKMLFYPSFFKDTIAVMPILFEYDAWAPWNKELFSDKLIGDVIDLFESWYGKGFYLVEHPEYGKTFVQIKGNREVTVGIKDDRMVNAWISDLRVVEEWRKLEETKSAN